MAHLQYHDMALDGQELPLVVKIPTRTQAQFNQLINQQSPLAGAAEDALTAMLRRTSTRKRKESQQRKDLVKVAQQAGCTMVCLNLEDLKLLLSCMSFLDQATPQQVQQFNVQYDPQSWQDAAANSDAAKAQRFPAKVARTTAKIARYDDIPPDTRAVVAEFLQKRPSLPEAADPAEPTRTFKIQIPHGNFRHRVLPPLPTPQNGGFGWSALVRQSVHTISDPNAANPLDANPNVPVDHFLRLAHQSRRSIKKRQKLHSMLTIASIIGYRSFKFNRRVNIGRLYRITDAGQHNSLQTYTSPLGPYYLQSVIYDAVMQHDESMNVVLAVGRMNPSDVRSELRVLAACTYATWNPYVTNQGPRQVLSKRWTHQGAAFGTIEAHSADANNIDGSLIVTHARNKGPCGGLQRANWQQEMVETPWVTNQNVEYNPQVMNYAKDNGHVAWIHAWGMNGHNGMVARSRASASAVRAYCLFLAATKRTDAETYLYSHQFEEAIVDAAEGYVSAYRDAAGNIQHPINAAGPMADKGVGALAVNPYIRLRRGYQRIGVRLQLNNGRVVYGTGLGDHEFDFQEVEEGGGYRPYYVVGKARCNAGFLGDCNLVLTGHPTQPVCDASGICV